MFHRSVVPALLVLGLLAIPVGHATASARDGLDRSFGEDGLVQIGEGDGRFAEDSAGRFLLASGTGKTLRVVRLFPDGGLDGSFGVGGVAEVTLPWNLDRAEPGEAVVEPNSIHTTAIEVDPDGNVVAAVSGAIFAVHGVSALIRFTPAGALDPSFGGRPNRPEAPGQIYFNRDRINAILFQGRRLLIGGVNGRGYLMRLEADGTLDRSFAHAGVLTVPPRPDGRNEQGGRNSGITDLGNATDGGFYAVGFAAGASMLAHLNRDGTFDRSFGIGGIVRTDTAAVRRCACSRANGIARDRRGRLLVVGSAAESATQERIFLARYRTDGNLDRTFGRQGIVRAAPGDFSRSDAVAVQADGRILIAGSATPAHVDDRGISHGRSSAVLYRFLPSGRLDRSFFHRGLFRSRFGFLSSVAHQVRVDPRGRILLGVNGGPYRTSEQFYSIARFLPGRRSRDHRGGGDEAEATDDVGARFESPVERENLGYASAAIKRYADRNLDSYEVSIRASSHRALSAQLQVTEGDGTHCEGYPSGDLTGLWAIKDIKITDGHFHAVDLQDGFGDIAQFRVMFRGALKGGAIRGVVSLRYKRFIKGTNKFVPCWSGRSAGDPLIHFVARAR